MTQKLAVAIIHGAGTPEENFADEMIEKLRKEFSKQLSEEIIGASDQLVFHPVYWSKVFETEEKELWKRLQKGGEMNFNSLRVFTTQFLADAIAYQPTTTMDDNYDKVHSILAQSLRLLAEQAGPGAPLCAIGHSLGCVVASNYFYDLQFNHSRIGTMTRKNIQNYPIEKGETLTLLYTLGNPLALWTLRYSDFGHPIQIPSSLLAKHYPDLQGEWLNFYDRDDVLAYPLKALNEKYMTSVTKDIEVNAGGLLKSWNPFSHSEYMTDEEVIRPIVDGLIKTWRQVNEH